MNMQTKGYLPEYAVFAEGRQRKIFSNEQDARTYYDMLLESGRDAVLVKREVVDETPFRTPPAVA